MSWSPRGARRGAASTLRRYREIAAVLVAHGLADIGDALRLNQYLAWGTRLLPGRARVDVSLSRAARVRLTLEELGPTFVKFGQTLSVRSDLLPPDLIAELTKLQERVPPLAPGVAQRAVEAELGRPLGDLFQSFEHEPLAAASIAQVHGAVLSSGERVVVKVRRPGIEQTIAGDIEIMTQLAGLAERHVAAAAVLAPIALVEEFARTIRAELDFVREARNLERCARHFADDPTVRFPRVHADRTTRGVLTMERFDGLKLSELEEAGTGPFARALIARRGADAMLAQILVHGFFHADPHPGNVVVLPGNVIGFIDLGIVGRIDEHTRRQLAHVIRAVWQRDAAALTTQAIDIAEPRGEVDVRALERDMSFLLDTYGDVPLGELSAAEVLGDVVGVAARHRLKMPSSLMALIKALVTIEGVGRQLDPSFKVIEHAAPLAERLWRDELTPPAITRRLMETAQETVEALRALPMHLDAIGRKARAGQLEVRFVHRNLDHFVREMDRSSNRLAFAVIIAALIVGSSLVIQSGKGHLVFGYPAVGLAGFLIAGVFGIGLAIGIARSGRL